MKCHGNGATVVSMPQQSDPNGEQERKKSSLIRLLESLITEVQSERLFGEFTISFSAQSGKISHYEELRKRTFK